jgi:hypothetical protein
MPRSVFRKITRRSVADSLRREEGTRLAQEAQRSKADAEAEMQRAQAFQSELVSWEQQNKPKLTAYETYIKNLGIPEERVLSGANPNPPAPGQPAVTNPQPPGYRRIRPDSNQERFCKPRRDGPCSERDGRDPFRPSQHFRQAPRALRRRSAG